MRNLQTLTESTQRPSEGLKESHPEIAWRAISGFRNILAHDYLGVDLERVWGVVENRLPHLRRAVTAILGELA